MAKDVNRDDPPEAPPSNPQQASGFQFVPGGAIAKAYFEVSAVLGDLTSNEMPTHDGVGRWQTFADGIIVCTRTPLPTRCTASSLGHPAAGP